jgi:hypothetical protein
MIRSRPPVLEQLLPVRRAVVFVQSSHSGVVVGAPTFRALVFVPMVVPISTVLARRQATAAGAASAPWIRAGERKLVVVEPITAVGALGGIVEARAAKPDLE